MPRHSLRMSAAPPLTMAPNPSSDMIEQSDKVTGFFSLPRELRDRIYDMVREDHHSEAFDVELEFRAAIPEKRLVSRQFKLEYDQRIAANTFVYVVDMFDMCIFEHFPRLTLNARYLALDWESDNPSDEDVLPALVPLGARVKLPLKARLKSLENLVGRFTKIKAVNIQLVHDATHNLKDVVCDLIACPVLTSFTVTSETFLSTSAGVLMEEKVDFAIWSRENGFLVDNTDEEKAKQELEAAHERHSTRGAEEHESGQVGSRKVDSLYFSGVTYEGSIDDFLGQ